MSEPRASNACAGEPGRGDADEREPGGGAGEPSGARGEDAGRHERADRMPPASEGSGRQPPKLVVKLRERREAYRQRGRAYRIAWITAGVIVILAGLVMIVFPGPALVVIPIGLAMLSLEFAWAERLLDTTLERGIDAKDIALGASRRQKIVGIAAIVCAVAAVAAVAVLYVL